MDPTKRGLVIHSCDGSKIHIDFPVQAANELVALYTLEEIIKLRHIIAEVDGAVIVIPFDNVKYFQAFPALKKLPRDSILAASVHD